jgi:hypothetical protein
MNRPKLIPTPPPIVTPYVKSVADEHINKVNAMVSYLADQHMTSYDRFWNDKKATPSQQLAAMGNLAGLWIATASQSAANIAALVAIGNLARPTDPLTVDNYIPSEYRVPRLPFIINPDGTVTLEMVDGLDEWGNPIPEPEPEPEVILEPEPEPED